MIEATYHDTYFGAVRVRLAAVGRNGLSNWEPVERVAVTCGYRNAPAGRLLAQARRDRRFSGITTSALPG